RTRVLGEWLWESLGVAGSGVVSGNRGKIELQGWRETLCIAQCFKRKGQGRGVVMGTRVLGECLWESWGVAGSGVVSGNGGKIELQGWRETLCIAQCFKRKGQGWG
nr:hypothetical protein [Tanacetum cinerariifolium]